MPRWHPSSHGGECYYMLSDPDSNLGSITGTMGATHGESVTTPTRRQRRAELHQSGERSQRRSRSWLPWMIGGLATALVVGGVIALTRPDPHGGKSTGAATKGLPDTPDYHSLSVDPDDSRHVLLGTHIGLFESRDGGRSWRATDAFEGDAMNLARVGESDTLFAAGHQLFKRSTDGGKTWSDVPLDAAISETRSLDGAKAVDIHGFATDPDDDDTVYAAIANRGLFRSSDGARSFVKLSTTGAAAMGVGVAPTTPRRIYLGDMERGLIVSADDGNTWKRLRDGIMNLAIDPSNLRRMIGVGAAVYLTEDGGETFTRVLSNQEGFGPVAFAPSHPSTAFVIGFDRSMYVSRDGGRTWRKVDA